MKFKNYIKEQDDKEEEELTCDECGKKDKTVKRQIDPFDQDRNNTEIWRNLCPYCYHDRRMDI